MGDAGIMDWALTFTIIFGIFFMAYTAYRQQGLIDTVNEIKEIFEEKVDDVAMAGGIYK